MVDEITFISYLSYSLLFIAPPVSLALIYLSSSPYGRYAASEKDGQNTKTSKLVLASKTTIPARLAWVIMESPAFLVTAFSFYGSTPETGRPRPVNNVLVALMLIHYFHRSVVYPMLIRGGKPFPISTFLFAFSFCSFNGYLQGRSLFLNEYPDNWFVDPRFVIGFATFSFGMAVNVHSDHVLRNLRKPGETGYKIPRGGMFEFVSAANMFGEIVEWCGFAVACWSLPAFSFAVFVVANLVPRGMEHHQWYLTKFREEYPAGRCAIFPFLM